jgi:hypothetical protein
VRFAGLLDEVRVWPSAIGAKVAAAAMLEAAPAGHAAAATFDSADVPAGAYTRPRFSST